MFDAIGIEGQEGLILLRADEQERLEHVPWKVKFDVTNEVPVEPETVTLTGICLGGLFPCLLVQVTDWGEGEYWNGLTIKEMLAEMMAGESFPVRNVREVE